MSSERRNLVVIRSGPSSLHGSITERLAEQNFDYALSWFSDEDPGPLAEGAVFVHRVKGPKWLGLHATLTEHLDTVSRYDRVWLPDDDLRCVPELVSEMFDIAAQLKADLAQPALSHDSYFIHAVTLRHPGFQLRFTDFVEVMAPLLSRDLLLRSIPLFAESVSGWGIDDVLSHWAPLGKMLIVDATPVVHTRPVGGPNYTVMQEYGVTDGWAEVVALREKHGVVRNAPSDVTVGGLTDSGAFVSFGTTEEDTRLLLAMITRDFLAATGHANAFQDYAAAGAALAQDPGNLSHPAHNTRHMVHYVMSVLGLVEGTIAFPFAVGEIPGLIAAALTEAGIENTQIHAWLRSR